MLESCTNRRKNVGLVAEVVGDRHGKSVAVTSWSGSKLLKPQSHRAYDQVTTKQTGRRQLQDTGSDENDYYIYICDGGVIEMTFCFLFVANSNDYFQEVLHVVEPNRTSTFIRYSENVFVIMNTFGSVELQQLLYHRILFHGRVSNT